MELLSLEDVRSRVQSFAQTTSPDRSDAELRAATSPKIDLARPDHRSALHRWLNAWGCRIRYPRTGEVDHFDDSIASWWETERLTLEAIDRPLAQLSTDQLHALGSAYERLNRLPVAPGSRSGTRSLGPTAAAKALYALRPQSVMPWDLEIALQLHGGRDGEAFTKHLLLGQQWARGLLAESGLNESQLLAELGRPESSLAKVLDEYCYVRYTRKS